MGRAVEGSEDASSARITIRALPTNDDGHPAHSIRVATVDVGGLPTDVMVQSFADRVFVAVSQMDKLGTIMSVEHDVALSGAESFSVDTLIGRREEPVLELCARRVAGFMSDAGCTKPLLIAIALREHSREVLSAILDIVQANRVW